MSEAIEVLGVGLVENILGEIESTNIAVNISVSGRNVIIVGANGSGKTSFLRGIFNSIKINIIDGHFFNEGNYVKAIKDAKKIIEGQPNASRISVYRGSLAQNQELLNLLKVPFHLRFNNPNEFLELYNTRAAVISMFEAGRKAAIRKVESATGRSGDIYRLGIEGNYGVNLEQYLVNLEIGSALAMRKGDFDRVKKIDDWLAVFLKNLRYLFENELLELEFDDEKLCFFINQPGRPKYSFQTLSSGYLAIFDIYADLLMRAEYRDITPAELVGVVLIDEIDAHLHISLQRKILPFLMMSFPKIQFIITTHSPFVVTSVDDALIYDISTGKECEDLSMYSVETVIEGLLGIPPISRKLEEIVKSLASATSRVEFEVDEVETLLNKISPYIDSLDDESKLFYEMSLNKFIKKKRGSV